MTERDLQRLQSEGKIKGFFAKPKGKKKAEKQTDLFGNEVKDDKKRKNEEFKLQKVCNDAFKQFWPEYVAAFYAIPNAFAIPGLSVEQRKLAGKWLNDMGRKKGVLDQRLDIPSGDYWELWVEYKTDEGYLTSEQEQFINLLIRLGRKSKIVIVRNSEQFLREIDTYLQTNKIKF